MAVFDSDEWGASSGSASALSRAWSLTAQGLACGRIYEHLGHRAYRAGPSAFIVEELGGEVVDLPNAYLAARRLSVAHGTATVPLVAGGYRRVQEGRSRLAEVMRRRLFAWATARRPQPGAPALSSRSASTARRPVDARR